MPTSKKISSAKARSVAKVLHRKAVARNGRVERNNHSERDCNR